MPETIDRNQAYAVLVGAEGATGNRVTLAVPNRLLETERGQNASGFTFGTVQLDIGNNTQAKEAYREILALGVNHRVITREQADDLARYAVVRPDLQFPDTYRTARATLNSTVFSPESAIAAQVKEVVANHQRADLESRVVPIVNRFLRTHSGGVFDPTHADHDVALASLVSASNRSGNLNRFSAALEGNNSPTLEDLKAAWARQIGAPGPNDWQLVEAGARSLSAGEHAAAPAPHPSSPGTASGLRESAQFGMVLERVRALHAENGIDLPREQELQVAGAVTAGMARQSMAELSSLEFHKGQLVFGQGAPGAVHSKVGTLDAREAAGTSLELSAQQFADAMRGPDPTKASAERTQQPAQAL